MKTIIELRDQPTYILNNHIGNSSADHCYLVINLYGATLITHDEEDNLYFFDSVSESDVFEISSLIAETPINDVAKRINEMRISTYSDGKEPTATLGEALEQLI